MDKKHQRKKKGFEIVSKLSDCGWIYITKMFRTRERKDGSSLARKIMSTVGERERRVKMA